MADQIRINGRMHNWASVRLTIAGEAYSGITSIDYGDTATPSLHYGSGGHFGPRGKAPGKYEVRPVVIEAPLDSAEEIKEQLASLAEAGQGISSVDVPILLQYEQGADVISIDFERCNLFSVGSSSSSQSADAITERMEFQPMQIIHNGKRLNDDLSV